MFVGRAQILERFMRDGEIILKFKTLESGAALTFKNRILFLVNFRAS